MFSSTDLQFLLTLVAGMVAFWLSGHLPALVSMPTVHNQWVSYFMYLIPAILIYGIVMVIWAWIILGSRRALKPVLIAGGLAAVLALASSLALTFLGSHLQVSVAVLAFILYLIYGIYFVIGWAVARRIAR